MGDVENAVPDKELVQRAAAGSLTAFEDLVYRYESRIYGFVFQSCRNAADASEITQDTFVRAFNALAQFNPRFPFASWLFSIARRKCIDFHRSEKPVSESEVPDVPDLNDPSELMSRKEDRQNLWRVAQKLLPEIQFHVLWFKYVEEMDVAEIARVMQKTKTHIKVLLFRARKTLVSELEKRSRSAKASKVAPKVSSQPKAATYPVTPFAI